MDKGFRGRVDKKGDVNAMNRDCETCKHYKGKAGSGIYMCELWECEYEEGKRTQTLRVDPTESFYNKVRWMGIKARILKRKAKEREEFLRRMRAK